MTDEKHLEFLLRVSERVHLPPSVIQSVLDVAIDEMSWPEIDAFHRERAKGQDIYEDAGGYFLRFIGRLFGARNGPDEVISYQRGMRAMVREAINAK